jgi:hypothetical protein
VLNVTVEPELSCVAVALAGVVLVATVAVEEDAEGAWALFELCALLEDPCGFAWAGLFDPPEVTPPGLEPPPVELALEQALSTNAIRSKIVTIHLFIILYTFFIGMGVWNLTERLQIAAAV